MVLLLRESDVESLMDMKSSISCLEAAFQEQSGGRVLQPERQVIQREGSDAVVRLMAAYAPEIEALGVKALLGIPAKRRPNSTYFVSLLFDHSDAALLAIVAAGRLTQLRTGAASAIATKYLARSDFRTIGILGAGIQGYGQLEGVSSIARLDGGKVFDVDGAKADAFVERSQTNLGIRIEKASNLDELFTTDVICTATTSATPVLFGSELRTGTHINAIGSNAPNRQEIDESVLRKSKVFVDKMDQALAEAGDFINPIRKGLYIAEKIRGELCDIVSGKIKGRTSDEDITLFKSVGIALEDIAIARAAYDLALMKGVGQRVSL